ncbi:BspA family leucine-rich repeat surface protein [Bifidobacterium sp. ESL0763]|uniref:BspA family leucine-rich repeat surface protein n=1 Tax=Bifidobacterium sp. ESL0763 TaxID=2983227 RepID=UPI0023F7B052|nr:BspA family leucine-rich repeat surface protein [Bifidobacterium sp. ESL0763]MDF7663371.1 BspA family leucine-rich repeat surface protein [Bifidobacterium sp. ESL0763]
MAIGLAVASAMVVGPVMASANETASDTPAQQQAAQVTTTKPEPVSASAQPVQPAAGESGVQQTEPQAPSVSQQAQQVPGQQADTADETAADQATQQPQAQSDPDPSIKAQGDFGGNADGTEKVHWYVKEITQDQDVLHIGSGVLGRLEDSPQGTLEDTNAGRQLLNNIVRIVFDNAPDTHVVPTTMFRCGGLPSVEHIDNVGNLDFSRLQGQAGDFDLGGFFESDPKLQSLDLTGWGTGRTAPGAGVPGAKASSKWHTGMSLGLMALVEGDYALTEIKGLDDWDTSAVTNMDDTFRIDNDGKNGSQLTSIGDLSGWDMSNVTRTVTMFDNDTKLTNIGDLSNWNLGNVKIAEWMFSNTGIRSLGDVSNWGMGNVEDMQGIFSHMHNLTGLPGISSWDVSKNDWFTCMFEDDFALTSLDLGGWDTKAATDMEYMFFDDFSLTEIKGLEGFKTDNVTDMSYMFANASTDVNYSTLTSLGDLSNWKTSNVTNMSNMFAYQTKLKVKGIEGWNTSKVTDMSYAFNCDIAFDDIDISNWDTSAVINGTWLFPYNVKKITLGRLTKLDASFFSYSPTEAGATESNGYTGRWTQSDDSWTSVSSDDNQSLAALTQVPGFPGGTFGWQEFVTLNFDKNEPAGVNATGDANPISKVGFDVSKLTLDLPKLKSDRMERGFKGWNTERNGTGTQVPGGSYHNALRGAVDLFAQWKVPTTIGSGSISYVTLPTPAPPAIPIAPSPAPNPGGNGGNGGQGNNGGGQGGNGPVNYYTIYRSTAYSSLLGAAPSATDSHANANDHAKSATRGKARPKCMPASVSKRLKAKKTHTAAADANGRIAAADWVTIDGAQGNVKPTTNGWSDSDYIGLPRCSVPVPEAATVKPAVTHHFNWLWLLLLLLVVAVAVAVYLYERNKDDDLSAQHRDGDGIAF